MVNDIDKKKVKDFINHLLNNPTISGEPILIGEGLILNFIAQNMKQLQVTFKTDQYFPHLKWEDVLKTILNDLYGRISEEVNPVFIDFIENANLESLNTITDSSLPGDFHKEKMTEFLESIMKNKDVRYNMNSVYNIFKYNVIEKYVTEIFNRHDSIYNELVRVQRTYLECDEYIVFMKVLLLVKNAVFDKIISETGNPNKKIGLHEISVTSKIRKFIDALTMELRNLLPNLNDRIISLALKSNLKENLLDNEDASSKFIFILSSRFQNFRPITTIDRGAESPDKSWFSIARKNHQHYGFDKRMLEDLYRIAGDNNW